MTLNDDEPLLNFACEFNLRRHAEVTKLPTDYVAGTGVASQVTTLFHRHGLLTVRDSTLYIGRMIMLLVSMTFLAIIYVKCRDRVQDQVLARMWMIAW